VDTYTDILISHLLAETLATRWGVRIDTVRSPSAGGGRAMENSSSSFTRVSTSVFQVRTLLFELHVEQFPIPISFFKCAGCRLRE
jgi:hypothetical protein